MKISDLFTLHQGNNFKLCDMNVSDTENINFVSRTSQNNGVAAKVYRDDAKEPFSAGFITVALGGSVLSSFVQTSPFYTAYHIKVLEPKREMSLNEKLFYCMCIHENRYRYNYGRQANKTLQDIEIPDRVPAWVDDTKIQPISTCCKNEKQELEIQSWRYFMLGDLFDFVKGKRLVKADTRPGDINFVGAISENNGVREKVDAYKVFAPNCITVNYNGSVGEAFYQKEPFWASDDVNVLYAKDFWQLNEYIAMFIITMIKANKYQFNYGRKWTLEKMEETVIMLPGRPDGLPDFEYMENYVRSLPYGDRIGDK